MILYHYTAIELLSAIEREGLTKGEVAITPYDLENAVWLTTDQQSDGHGLTDGGFIPEAEHADLERRVGHELSPIVRPDKRRVRIAVTIPSHDRKLKPWLPYADRRLTKEWLECLTKSGGGKAKAETWRIYLGTIPPARFRSIEVRDASGVYRPITAADRAEASTTAIDANDTFQI